MKSNPLLEAIKKRTAFLQRASETAQAKENRKIKLISKNMYIDEATPKYKETYTGNKA